MRLIDADDVANAIYHHFPSIRTMTDARGVIEEAPTIEPKRGEWIDDDFVGQYRCSECDYYAIDEYDYCPNCGADMRGADDD